MRQFKDGDREQFNGLWLRVRKGNKGPHDLMLEAFVPTTEYGDSGWCFTGGAEWRPVEMKAIGMAHAFFCENEDVLYPPPRFMGAGYWRAFLQLCEQNFRGASKKMATEKAWADRKRRGAA